MNWLSLSCNNIILICCSVGAVFVESLIYLLLAYFETSNETTDEVNSRSIYFSYEEFFFEDVLDNFFQLLKFWGTPHTN